MKFTNMQKNRFFGYRNRLSQPLFLLLVIAPIAIFAQPLYAAGGVMLGEKDLRIISTQSFDIIFPAHCIGAAEHLAQNADSIYSDVCNMLGVEEILRNVRYPVTLSPAREEYNAFYTQFFANHIVIYDTPSPRNSLTSSDTFLETFRHELTHAVTCNMKNAFWRGVTRISGDGAVLGAAILTKSHLEGIAVVSESIDGQGRLNDPYSFLSIRQAKIEGCFPHYADVYGARDAYPADVYYSFGAAFDDYLRLTYGIKKYAAFWYKCINLKTIHQSFAFKSVFGITMKEAWKDFYESISVPNIDADPCINPDVSYWSEADNFIGARYDCLSQDDAGDILYCNKRTGAVYLNRGGKKRHIFTVANNSLTGVRLSNDGNFVAVSMICRAHVARKTEVRIFDIAHRKWHRLPDTGLREGVVLSCGGKDYACAVRTSSQNQEIVLWELYKKDNAFFGGIKAAEYAALPLDTGVSVYDLTAGGGSRIACVMQRDNACSFVFIDIADLTMREVPLPDGVKARDIALVNSTDDSISISHTDKVGEQGAPLDDREYTFSYAYNGILPRLGLLKMSDEGAEYLWPQKTDMSGGVTCPVQISDGKVLYAGQFFQDSRLLVMTVPKTNTETTAAVISIRPNGLLNDRITEAAIPLIDDGDSKYISNCKKLNRLFPVPITMLRGMWLPVSAAFIYDLDGNRDKWLPFGVTAATASPWFNGTGYALFTAGYYGGDAAAQICITGGTDSQIFRYTLNAQAAFDIDSMDFRQTSTNLNLTSVLPASMTSNLFISNETRFLFDKETLNAQVLFTTPFGTRRVNTKTDMNYIYVDNWTSVLWSNIHQAGESTFEQCGAGAGVFVDMEYKKYDYELYNTDTDNFNGEHITRSDWRSNPGLQVKAAIPRLLPFKATSRITANLPITAEAMLFPSANKLFTHTEAITLFGYEVQKAIPFASIAYINRIALECTYTGKFYYTDGDHSWAVADAYDLIKDALCGEMWYRDKLCFLAAITATPNYGAATALHFTIRGGLGLRLNKNPAEDCAEGLLSLSLKY